MLRTAIRSALLALIVGVGAVCASPSLAQAAGNAQSATVPGVPVPALPAGTGLVCSVFIVPFNSGYVVDATISNAGATTSNGWELTFTLPVTTTVTSVFTGNMTRSGDQAAIVNAFYSGNIAPGHTIDTGFQASFTGPFIPPSNFALNGSPCTVTINS